MTTTTRTGVLTGLAQRLDELPAPVATLVDGTDHLYASLPWLRIEQDVAADPPLHLWAHGPDVSGFAAAYRFDASSNPWPIARLDLFLRALGADPEATAAALPCYLVGGRRPGHSRILTAGAPERRPAVLAMLLEQAVRHAADRGAATVAALYCDEDDRQLAAALRDLGGFRLPSHATYVLDVPGAAYTDWLASLPRKQRLNELADERKLAGVEFDVRPLRAADLDRVAELELGLYQKYGNDYRPDEARRLHEAYLAHLTEDQALLVTAHRDGELIGFASLVRHGRAGFLRQGGFDESRCAGVPVYFGAAFHTVLRWAYRAGVRSLDYSISAGAVKRRRGCQERGRSAWVVPITADARRLLEQLDERSEPT